MSEVRTIILHHKRSPELVNDVHLYSGSIDLQDAEGKSVLEGMDFIAMPFRKMLVHVSRYLRQHEDAAVIFRRLDRKGLRPLQLSEELRLLLRDDPVRAIRHMDVQLDEPVKPDAHAPAGLIRSNYDTLADAFSERVYARMKNGAVEDPVTGHWKQLAYGPKCGWRIRGEKNSYESWVPVRLEGVEIPDVREGASPDEVREMMDELGVVLATCRWASMLVEDLLQQAAHKFFLPRRWNAASQWVGRNVLRARLDKYLREREEAQS